MTASRWQCARAGSRAGFRSRRVWMGTPSPARGRAQRGAAQRCRDYRPAEKGRPSAPGMRSARTAATGQKKNKCIFVNFVTSFVLCELSVALLFYFKIDVVQLRDLVESVKYSYIQVS